MPSGAATPLRSELVRGLEGFRAARARLGRARARNASAEPVPAARHVRNLVFASRSLGASADCRRWRGKRLVAVLPLVAWLYGLPARITALGVHCDGAAE
jgi:hypothetical protein